AQRVSQGESGIEAEIAQLASSDQRARSAALEQVAKSGVAAVNPLLRALADPSRAAEHAIIRSALVQVGQSIDAPLIAALDAKNEALKNQIIALVGRLGSRRASFFLIRLSL